MEYYFQKKYQIIVSSLHTTLQLIFLDIFFHLLLIFSLSILAFSLLSSSDALYIFSFSSYEICFIFSINLISLSNAFFSIFFQQSVQVYVAFFYYFYIKLKCLYKLNYLSQNGYGKNNIKNIFMNKLISISYIYLESINKN